MADVLVKKSVVKDGRIESMNVGMYGLPDRTVDRDQVLAWMRDGHSLIPVKAGKRLTALQLVEVGEDAASFVRHDNEAKAEDSVPV